MGAFYFLPGPSSASCTLELSERREKSRSDRSGRVPYCGTGPYAGPPSIIKDRMGKLGALRERRGWYGKSRKNILAVEVLPGDFSW